MRAKELMDNEFVYLNCDDSVVEVSKVMEEIRRFTCPVVNENKQLVGWVTSFDITKGLREGNEKISETEAEALIKELLTLENPYHCPHGRPVMFTMSKSNISHQFKRT